MVDLFTFKQFLVTLEHYLAPEKYTNLSLRNHSCRRIPSAALISISTLCLKVSIPRSLAHVACRYVKNKTSHNKTVFLPHLGIFRENYLRLVALK